jgi:hypothetical protein
MSHSSVAQGEWLGTSPAIGAADDQTSGSCIVTFAVIYVDFVQAIGVYDGETLRCGVGVCAVESRCVG